VFSPLISSDYTLILFNFMILPLLVNVILPLFNMTLPLFWLLTRGKIALIRGKIALTRGKIALTCERQGQNHKVKENEGTITISM